MHQPIQRNCLPDPVRCTSTGCWRSRSVPTLIFTGTVNCKILLLRHYAKLYSYLGRPTGSKPDLKCVQSVTLSIYTQTERWCQGPYCPKKREKRWYVIYFSNNNKFRKCQCFETNLFLSKRFHDMSVIWDMEAASSKLSKEMSPGKPDGSVFGRVWKISTNLSSRCSTLSRSHLLTVRWKTNWSVCIWINLASNDLL